MPASRIFSRLRATASRSLRRTFSVISIVTLLGSIPAELTVSRNQATKPSCTISSGSRLIEIARRRSGPSHAAAARSALVCTRRDRRSDRPAAAARANSCSAPATRSQRASASAPSTTPVEGLICGWKTTATCLMSDDGGEQVVATPARSGGPPFVRTLLCFYAIPLVHEAWLASARRARYRPPKPRPTTGQWRAPEKCLCSGGERIAA